MLFRTATGWGMLSYLTLALATVHHYTVPALRLIVVALVLAGTALMARAMLSNRARARARLRHAHGHGSWRGFRVEDHHAAFPGRRPDGSTGADRDTMRFVTTCNSHGCG